MPRDECPHSRVFAAARCSAGESLEPRGASLGGGRGGKTSDRGERRPDPGGPSHQLTRSFGTGPFESPDGSLLYYTNGQGLWSMPPARGDPKLVLPESGLYRYAVAGRGIYGFPDPRSLWVLRTDTGRKFEYVRFPNDVADYGAGTLFTVSAGERTILFARTDSQDSDLKLVANFRLAPVYRVALVTEACANITTGCRCSFMLAHTPQSNWYSGHSCRARAGMDSGSVGRCSSEIAMRG